jgi:acyl carrier protein
MADAETILEFIREELLEGDEEIDADTSLFRSQLLDSLSLTGLIVILEETYGIRIGAMDISYDNLDTVNLMVDFVEKKRAASA